MKDLPKWVWDVLAELLDQEDSHPTLYYTASGMDGYAKYDWCPMATLEKVPEDVRKAADVVRAYRRSGEVTE